MNHFLIKNDAELCDYIEEFKFTFECPKLFVCNYFSKIKSEIDLPAEKLLNLNNDSSEIFDQINKKRQSIIDEIANFETQVLKSLKQTLNAQLRNEVSESLKIILDDEFKKRSECLKNKVSYVFEKYKNLKRSIFMNKNLIFSKKLCNDYCKNDNTWFGILIWLDEYLDENEIDYHFDFYKKIEFELSNDTIKINYLIEEVLKNKNLLRHIQKIEFNHLYGSDILQLYFKKIKSINQNAFFGFENLKCLELNQNKIDTIHPGSFKTLDKLEELKFEKLNPILFSTLCADTFSGLQNLSSLQISDADFSDGPMSINLKRNIFSNLKSLHFLHLSNNNIKEIEPGFFNGNNCLKTLFLSGNQIKNLDCRSFQGLDSLEALYLNYNRLESLEMTVFSHLTQLKELHIESNEITDLVKEENFSELESLVELNLATNSIKKIDPGYFGMFPNLEKLNLFSNQIENIDEATFSCLNMLTSLELNLNNIKEIKQNTFRGMINLKTINLSSNKITTIDKNLFKELRNIEEIDLSDNKLDKIMLVKIGLDEQKIII